MSKILSPFNLSIAGLIALEFCYPYVKKRLVDAAEDKSSDIQRVKVSPLLNLKQIFKDIKFDFHNISGVQWKSLFFWATEDDYWIDGVGYKVSQDRFKKIIKTTHELHNMCLEATDFAISDDEILQKLFDIPYDMIPMVRESWKQRQTDLLSRYDFLMGKEGELYFLEVNGDTPSGIIEAGPAQKKWAEQLNLLQFNTLEQNITEGFQKIIKKNNKNKLIMYANENFEDSCTFKYLKTILEPVLNVPIQETGIENITSETDGLSNRDLYKNCVFWRQYPLEWLASESPNEIFKDPTFYKHNTQTLIEPPWKIVMSNKAMSVLLQAMYPNNPHIIESKMASFPYPQEQLSKQKYAREGDAILLSSNYETTQPFLVDSYYQYVHPPIFQKFVKSDLHQNRYLTISSWVVSGQPSGILLREDLSSIIGTGSSVVPYFIQNDKENQQTIEIELENSPQQQQIRESLYDNSKINSDIMVKINQRTSFINNNMIDKNSIKSNLQFQYERAEQERQKIFSLDSEQLDEEQSKYRLNPMLVGFAPLALASLAGQTGSVKREEQETQGRYVGSGGRYYNSYNSSADNVTKTAPKAGQTGRTFSSHS